MGELSRDRSTATKTNRDTINHEGWDWSLWSSHDVSRRANGKEKSMKKSIDKHQFGPWALVTGASSGIGKEFARQIAASGINVVLVARRDALLAELGRAISQEFDVQYRALAIDLSQEGFISGLADATDDIDIGLVVSNAGTASPGEFLKLERPLLQATLRLNTMAHLD